LKLKQLEQQKLFEPRFSCFCKDISNYFNTDKENYQFPVGESRSFKNFEVMNEEFSFDNYEGNSFLSIENYLKSKNSLKARSPDERRRLFTPCRSRPISSKLKGSLPSSSRKSFISRGKKKGFVPYKYYHDKTLAMISGKIEKNRDIL
jgi:hypothetical protein